MTKLIGISEVKMNLKNMQTSKSHLFFLIVFSDQAMLLVLLYKILSVINNEFLVNF